MNLLSNFSFSIWYIFMTVMTLTISSCGMSREEKENVILENIMTRTSVRSYTDKEVEKDKVEKLLKAAMAAPTAVNTQPWAFVVVDQKDILLQLADSLPYAKMTAKAPLAIVACGVMDKTLKGDAKDYWIQDVSASIENLLLAAHAMELGAVWTGLYPLNDRVSIVQQILGIPADVIPVALIPIGYPDSENKPKNKWKEGNVHTNKW